jgi:hypothetical protein
MPQHALSTQPANVDVVLWREQSGELAGMELGRFFPDRAVANFSLLRQREHSGAAQAISALLGHENWCLRHDEHGKPTLEMRNGDRSGVSLSHCELDGEIWVAAARWRDGRTTGGIDLVLTDDARVVRVAPRVMSRDEQDRWAGREAWAWGVKEAMFKGHGPALEFQRDALLDEVTENGSGTGGRLTGRVRGADWCGAWSLEQGRLLVVWAE